MGELNGILSSTIRFNFSILISKLVSSQVSDEIYHDLRIHKSDHDLYINSIISLQNELSK